MQRLLLQMLYVCFLHFLLKTPFTVQMKKNCKDTEQYNKSHNKSHQAEFVGNKTWSQEAFKKVKSRGTHRRKNALSEKFIHI